MIPPACHRAAIREDGAGYWAPRQAVTEPSAQVSETRGDCCGWCQRHAEPVEVQGKDAGLRYMKVVFAEINFIGALSNDQNLWMASVR